MATISRKALHARPQELGKIKIGGKGSKRQASGGREYRLPVKYDHFVVTTRKRDKDTENFIRDEEIHGHPSVGEAPTEIDGYLMYPTVEENFHAELVRYAGQQKIWSCDGEEATDLRNGSCSACPLASGKECVDGKGKPLCKPYARLHLQLLASKNTLGFHVFRTTSWESTNNIQGALEEIYARFGTLMGAPVRLVLYPSTDSYEENGQSKTSESHKVGLVLAVPFEELAKKLVANERLLVGTREKIRLLAAGVVEELEARDVEEAADIGEEFFPPDVAVQSSIETQQRLDSFKGKLRGDEPPIQDAVVVENSPPAGEAGIDSPTPSAAAPVEAAAEPPTTDAEPVDDVATLRARYLELIKTQAQHLAQAAVRKQWKKRVLAREESVQDRELGEFDLQCLVTAIEAGDTDPERSLAALNAAMEPAEPDLEDGDIEVMP